MDGEIANVPNIDQPIGLSQLTDAQLEQKANELASLSPVFSKDQFLNTLEVMRAFGIKLEQKHLNRLEAGEPILPSSELLPAGTNLSGIEEIFKTNGWLQSTPLTAYVMTFTALMLVLQEAKLKEIDFEATWIGLAMEISKDVGKLIKESAEAEAAGMRDQAIASMVSGAISAVGAAVSVYGALGKGALYRDKSGKVSTSKGAGKTYDPGATAAKWQAVNSMTQGLSTTAQAVGGFLQADATLKKGLKDQLRTVMEQVKSILDRGIGTAGEGRGGLQQEITQLLEYALNIIRSFLTAKHIERT